jgi:hypothetical protein
MQIVERAYGMLELHSQDKGQVEAAVDAILGRMGGTREDRIRPRVVSSQVITGIDGKQSQLINRMRHGDMIMSGQTLYIPRCIRPRMRRWPRTRRRRLPMST